MKIFLIPWCLIFLLLHDEIEAQSPSQTMTTNIQPTSAQFASMNLFPILRQFPITFDQYEALHQKAQEEFFRQQKQIQDQLLGPLQQPFSAAPLFPQSNGQLAGLSFLLPPNRQLSDGGTVNSALLQPLRQASVKKPNLSVLSPLPTPYPPTQTMQPKETISQRENVDLVRPTIEGTKVAILSQSISEFNQKFDEKKADQMVAQMLHLDSGELKSNSPVGVSHKHHKEDLEKRKEGRSGERSMERAAHGEITLKATSESHDENSEENARDIAINKKEKSVDIQKLFHALGLTTDEKKEIVQRVEQLLKEEIAHKILGDMEKSTTTVTSIMINPNMNTEGTPIHAELPLAQKSVEPIAAIDATTKPPELMSGLIHIREQKEIRETQPKVPMIEKPAIVSTKIVTNEDFKNLEVMDKKAMHEVFYETDTTGSRPLQTTETHLNFNNQKQSEDGIGKIRTRRIHHDENEVQDVDTQIPPVTAPPLDLREADLVTEPESVVDQEEVTTLHSTITTTEYEPMSNANYLPARIKNQPHLLTAFERLANDYRERLEGTDSVGRLLASFYKDAYIVLRQRDDNSAISRPRRHPQRRNHRKVVL